MTPPGPVSLLWNQLAAVWVGQDWQNLQGPGDAHVALSGLPTGASIVSATLSDQAKMSWYYSASGGPTRSIRMRCRWSSDR
jgi:hypothetical protein